jgi:hypothetical protein
VRYGIGRRGPAIAPFRALRRTDGFGAALKTRAHSSSDVAPTFKACRSGR